MDTDELVRRPKAEVFDRGLGAGDSFAQYHARLTREVEAETRQEHWIRFALAAVVVFGAMMLLQYDQIERQTTFLISIPLGAWMLLKTFSIQLTEDERSLQE